MGWLLAAAVFLLSVAFVLRSKSPKRAIAIAIAAILAVIGAIGILLFDTEATGPARIAVQDLALTSVRISSDRYGGQLIGRVTNNSTKRLGTMTLLVTFKECAAEKDCRTLFTQSPRVFLALPAGQTGSFSVLLAEDLPTDRPDVKWDCTIAEATVDF
jgi:hypothetical protein